MENLEKPKCAYWKQCRDIYRCTDTEKQCSSFSVCIENNKTKQPDVGLQRAELWSQLQCVCVCACGVTQAVQMVYLCEMYDISGTIQIPAHPLA